ncbi:MAG: hypothetical protein RR945_01760 [Erysipelotrichaceae bacterium]
MDKEEFTRLREKLEQIDGLLIEVTNDFSDLDELDDYEELDIDFNNIQGKLTNWLDTHQDLSEDIRNEETNEIVCGYIYNDRGYHGNPFIFEGSMKNIANFIMTQENNRIVITSAFDEFRVSTFGFYLDKVESEEFRQELLKELLPLQQCEVDASEIEYIERGDTLSEIDEMQMRMM